MSGIGATNYRFDGGFNFGDTPRRMVVDEALLKCAIGYGNWSTASHIIKEHGLVTDNNKLTEKGREYLWAVYSQGRSV